MTTERPLDDDADAGGVVEIEDTDVPEVEEPEEERDSEPADE
jgi:hypothetical protein